MKDKANSTDKVAVKRILPEQEFRFYLQLYKKGLLSEDRIVDEWQSAPTQETQCDEADSQCIPSDHVDHVMSKEERQEVYELYEKGECSGVDVLMAFGFDDNQKIDRGTMTPQSDLGHDPEMQILQKDNMRIANDELRQRVKLKEIEVIGIQVDHARRNLDSLGKIYHTTIEADDKKLWKKAFEKNIKLLDGVENIK